MLGRRETYQRRGRDALLRAAALFLLVQLIGGLLLDWRGLAVRFPSAARLLASAERRRPAPDIVILGSSRFQALQAGEIKRLLRLDQPWSAPAEVLNASVPAGDPIAESFMLERLLERGVRPRLVVVEVSPDTLNERNEWFRLHVHRQVTWRTLPTYFLDICGARELPRLVGSRVVPLYSHRRELCQWFGDAFAPSPRESSIRGDTVDFASIGTGSLAWDELLTVTVPPLSPAEQAASRNEAVLTKKRFRHYRPGGTTASALGNLLRRCGDNGIEVLLVGAPNNSYFRENFTAEVDGPYREVIAGLAERHGCRYVECRDRVPDQLFGDCCHLTPEGAIYFSRVLTREVLAPYWRERNALRVARAGR